MTEQREVIGRLSATLARCPSERSRSSERSREEGA